MARRHPWGSWSPWPRHSRGPRTLIQSVNSTQQAGSEVVRIELSEPLAAVPAGFTVQTPPRMAIDLPGVGNSLGRSTVELNQGNLRTVNVAQSGRSHPARAESESSRPAIPPSCQGSRCCWCCSCPVDGPARHGRAGRDPSTSRPALNLDQLPLRTSTSAAARTVRAEWWSSLPNNQVGVDIRQQGQNLVIEFLRFFPSRQPASPARRDRLRHSGANCCPPSRR